jgi:RNA recognition motif-containing protein
MRLYVGNLPFAMADDGLRELFAAHGAVVRAMVVMDRETGRSRGFGFVEFGASEDGARAMEAMNGVEVGGRPLVVNEARPREEGAGPRRAGGGFRPGGGGGNPAPRDGAGSGGSGGGARRDRGSGFHRERGGDRGFDRGGGRGGRRDHGSDFRGGRGGYDDADE